MNLFDYCVVIIGDLPCTITHYRLNGDFLEGFLTGIHAPQFNVLKRKREDGKWIIRFYILDKRIRIYTGLTRADALKHYHQYIEEHFCELL